MVILDVIFILSPTKVLFRCPITVDTFVLARILNMQACQPFPMQQRTLPLEKGSESSIPGTLCLFPTTQYR